MIPKNIHTTLKCFAYYVSNRVPSRDFYVGKSGLLVTYKLFGYNYIWLDLNLGAVDDIRLKFLKYSNGEMKILYFNIKVNFDIYS